MTFSGKLLYFFLILGFLVRFYTREDTEDAVKYISGTILDDRPIRVDFDWGFQEGRQWGRGRSGGQVIFLTFEVFVYYHFHDSFVFFDISSLMGVFFYNGRFAMSTAQIMIQISSPAFLFGIFCCLLWIYLFVW